MTFLSQTQAEIPSSLQLFSSATVWTGHVATHQALLDRQEDKEVRRALAGRGGKRKRNAIPLDYESDGVSGDDDLADDQTDADGPNAQNKTENTVESSDAPASVSMPSSVMGVGSALKRNSDGTVVVPIRRRGNTTKVCVYGTEVSRRLIMC